MLARSFKSATELELTEKQWGAFVAVLHMLERGEVEHRPLRRVVDGPKGFNMGEWECGTARCIGGWASHFGARFEEVGSLSLELNELFMATEAGVPLRVISPTQAAAALSNYLVTGKPNWPDAMRTQTSAMQQEQP